VVVLLTVGNDGHVTDVRRVVHETTDLDALLVSHVAVFSNIVAWCGVGVRATYLLGGEAGDMLASCFVNSQCSFRPSQVEKSAGVAERYLLDHFGGVVVVFS
jgi:hypothetical protein